MNNNVTKDPALVAIADAYCDCWKHIGLQPRIELLSTFMSPDGQHSGSIIEAKGADGIAKAIEDILVQRPGCIFKRTTEVFQSGEGIQFGWRIGSADGVAFVDGTVQIALNPQGKAEMASSRYGTYSPPA